MTSIQYDLAYVIKFEKLVNSTELFRKKLSSEKKLKKTLTKFFCFYYEERLIFTKG